MQIGDMVQLKNRLIPLYGTIIAIDIHRCGSNLIPTPYLVRYDGNNLIPSQNWHSTDDIETMFCVRCECGVDSVMIDGVHSDYCPKYTRR